MCQEWKKGVGFAMMVVLLIFSRVALISHLAEGAPVQAKTLLSVTPAHTLGCQNISMIIDLITSSRSVILMSPCLI